MSLDKLKIPGMLVGDLYKNHLIDPEKGGKNSEKGKNTAVENKEVMVLVYESKPGAVSAAATSFITRILLACEWSIRNTSVINLNGASLTWSDIKAGGAPRICLLFGPDASAIDLPVIFPEFRVHPFEQTRFLHGPAPEKMDKDKLMKSKLWLCMKELFNV